MERKTIQTGHLLKSVISYDDNGISVNKEIFQSPVSIWPFKWRGFIGRQQKDFQFGEDVHYFFNTGKIFGRKTLYISKSGKYNQLPNSEEEMAEDDKDDLTFMQYANDIINYVARDDDDETDEDENADLKLKTDTIQIRLPREAMCEIEKALEASSAYKLQTKGCGCFFSPNRQLLAYDEEWAFHVKPALWGESEIDSIPIHYMAFLLKTKSLLQTFFGGVGLYCGYHRQIIIGSISGSAVNEFNAWCKQYAPRLNTKGTSVNSSVLANPFNLWRWIHPDRISITNEALIYTRRTLRRDEMIYLPYKRMGLFLDEGGWFFKRFNIYGEQNIIPKFSFWRGDYSEIKKAMKDHQVKITCGKSWSSSILYFKNWFGKAPRLVRVDDRLIYYPNRLKSEAGNGNARSISAKLSEIEEVIWHKGLFELLGTIEISGVTQTIRKDQSGKKFRMIVPNLWVFCYKYFFIFYFSGSLRDTLKKSDASFERKYHGSIFSAIWKMLTFFIRR